MKNGRRGKFSSDGGADPCAALASSRAREDKSRIIKLHSSTVPPLCTERRTYLDSSREGEGNPRSKNFFLFQSSPNFSLCCKKLGKSFSLFLLPLFRLRNKRNFCFCFYTQLFFHFHFLFPAFVDEVFHPKVFASPSQNFRRA